MRRWLKWRIVTNMETLLEQILRSPKLEIYFETIRDRLRDEQEARHRFYERITNDDKAEFINGEVVMQSPVTFRHDDVSILLHNLISNYVRSRSLGFVGHEKMLISLSRNDNEPDICFWRKEISDQFKPKQLQFPAPDFVAEVISQSTEATDRGVKFEDYAAHGVREYWIVDPDREFVEQHFLRDEHSELHVKTDTGTIASMVLDGLAIPVRGMFDDAENAAALRRLLAVA